MATGCSLHKGGLHGARLGKTDAQREHFVPITRGRDVSKRILMEFTTVSKNIQHIVIRNSKLAGPRRSASKWISWHRKTTPIVHCLRSARDIGKLVYHTEQIGQECTDETPIRLPKSSHDYEPSPPRI